MNVAPSTDSPRVARARLPQSVYSNSAPKDGLDSPISKTLSTTAHTGYNRACDQK
jgi:hypothetical protein